MKIGWNNLKRREIWWSQNIISVERDDNRLICSAGKYFIRFDCMEIRRIVRIRCAGRCNITVQPQS